MASSRAAGGRAATANAQIGPPQTDPAGLIDLPSGYSYTDLVRSCDPGVQSTEDGTVWPMPDDPDANVVFLVRAAATGS